MGLERGASPTPTLCRSATPEKDSLYTFNQLLAESAARDCPIIFGFPRIHLVFHPKLLLEAATSHRELLYL